MSQAKKRSFSLETEATDSKKCEKPPASSRPQRPAKRRKTEDVSDVPPPKPLEPKVVAKVKRQVWTAAATDAFFEGLCQHGKDFHQILKYMQNKYKKLKDPTIHNLTKNQDKRSAFEIRQDLEHQLVRFFFYRTWHKVSALLTDPSHPNPPPGCAVESGTTKKVKGLRLVCNEDFSQAEGRGVEEEEGEGENTLDSSLEEPELVETSPKGVGEAAELQEALEVGSPTFEHVDKVKDQVESSPEAPVMTAADKVEVKKDMLKDTSVVVNGVRKSLDLVALICYYKLKKKCPGEHNFGKKLSELVYQGTTTVTSRVKGSKRKVPIKVPNCRALRAARKTFPIDGEQAADQIGDQGCDGVLSEPEPCTPSDGPQHVTVELRPLSTASWLYVQGLAQNPRLRLTVSSSRTVLHLVQFLALKWQLKHGDSEDSLQLFHTYSKWRSMGLSPSTVPTNNCDSVGNCDLVENHEGEQTVESPVAEVTQGVASQRCCTTSSPVPEVDVQREGQQVNQEVATSEGSGNNLGQAGDLQCKSNTDGALCSCVATKILSPEIDSKSPQTQTVATSKHPSKCDYGQEKFSEPLYSEENASDSGSQFGITSRRLLFNSKCTLREIHYKFFRPECLQLLYELPRKEVAGEDSLHLRTALKLVEFISNSELVKHQQSPSKVLVSHLSPKVAEYMRTLAKRSPRKSPLSKYWRLKNNRSPLRSPAHQHPIKRVRLTFDTESGGTQGGMEQTPGHPLDSSSKMAPDQQHESKNVEVRKAVGSVPRKVDLRTKFRSISPKLPPTVTSSPVCSQAASTSRSSSPTVVNMLQIHQHSPEVIQLSKPGNPSRKAKHQLVTVSKASLGSFTNMKLHSLFSVVDESIQHAQSQDTASKASPISSKREAIKPQTTTKAVVSDGEEIAPVTSGVGHVLATRSEPVKVTATVYATPSTTLVNINSSTNTVPHGTDSHVLGAASVSSNSAQPVARGSLPSELLAPVSHGQELPPVAQSKLATCTQPSVSTRQPACTVITSHTDAATPTPNLPPVITTATQHPLFNLASAVLPTIQSAKPAALTTTANSAPPPMVTGLKPFSKPRRPKKPLNRTGQTRQLVPRPLPFLPNVSLVNGQLNHQTPLSSTTHLSAALPTVMTPAVQAPQAGPSPKQSGTSVSTAAAPQQTNQLLQNQLTQVLLQALLFQCQQKSQTAQLVSQTVAPHDAQKNKESAEPKVQMPSGTEKDGENETSFLESKGELPDISQGLSQGVNEVFLNNFLAEHPVAADSSGSSKLFNTSSDTVNELLRGLGSRRQDDSIKRLSEETANVLPTFARALDKSHLSTETTAECTDLSSDYETSAVHREDEVELSISTNGNDKGEDNQAEASEDNSSRLSFMNENSGACLSDVLGNISDSTFKQFAEMKDIFEEVDFSDVFSHLKDVIRTPEKLKQQEENIQLEDHPPVSDDSEASIGALLDFLTSPDKDQPKASAEPLQMVDPTYRSLIEESSVDYIQKFRDLASKMNHQK